MKIKFFILCFILLAKNALPADFEFSAGGSVNVGSIMNFSSATGVSQDRPEGFKMGSGINASTIIGLGHHYRLPGKTVARTISVGVDLGYNFYSGERDTIFSTYHSIIAGVVAKVHFNNYMAIGIGGGIYIPIALSLNHADPDLVVAGEKDLEKFEMEQIKFMYKMPFMPYVKVIWDNYIYFNQKWALKVDATLLYNLGMVLDIEKLNTTPTGYQEYNFSAFSVEVGASIVFGRPIK